MPLGRAQAYGVHRARTSHGLSVKVRGGRSLEVKVYRGGAGILDVASRARGRMESWQKWSFPGSPLDQYSGDPAGWRPVRKRRRISRFSFASGQIVAGAPGLDQEPRCDVELTEVSTRGQAWWTLGFEASGPADLLPSALEGTSRLPFTHPCPVRNPASMNPGPTCSGCSRRAGTHEAIADCTGRARHGEYGGAVMISISMSGSWSRRADRAHPPR